MCTSIKSLDDDSFIYNLITYYIDSDSIIVFTILKQHFCIEQSVLIHSAIFNVYFWYLL